MFPAFLITFREVIEATVIVATIAGILKKLNQQKSLSVVWKATITAVVVSVLLLIGASILGFNLQKAYSGKTEELIEGVLMLVSAGFITWAVFFLHTYFSTHKNALMSKVKHTIQTQQERGLFILVFTAVFREGFEIVLFLGSIYLSSNPVDIAYGFSGGIVLGLIVSYMFFKATVSMSIVYAFRVSSILLILFAGGLVARGIHEFAEAGLVTEYLKFTIPLIPTAGTIMGDMIKALFGITQKMDITQIIAYLLYVATMSWYVFGRKSKNTPALIA